jgi:aspartate-semialdehyde dehydrogenase
MVGQRFISLLDGHPWFEVVSVAASPRSKGKTYKDAVEGRWTLARAMPQRVAGMIVKDVTADIEAIADEVDFVCCALDMDKAAIRDVEDAYARRETPVISNNSAHRWTPDVPMLIPEINAGHIEVISAQRRRRAPGRVTADDVLVGDEVVVAHRLCCPGEGDSIGRRFDAVHHRNEGAGIHNASQRSARAGNNPGGPGRSL